jgi:hypothetical protein
MKTGRLRFGAVATSRERNSEIPVIRCSGEPVSLFGRDKFAVRIAREFVVMHWNCEIIRASDGSDGARFTKFPDSFPDRRELRG